MTEFDQFDEFMTAAGKVIGDALIIYGLWVGGFTSKNEGGGFPRAIFFVLAGLVLRFAWSNLK